jgi:hypothetical protein
MPALDVLSEGRAVHALGGDENQFDIAYTGKAPDSRWKGLTYNTQSPYVMMNFSLKNGPVVVDVPPASDTAKFYGSIFNVWYKALEDVGPSGLDAGKGGKYLLLPPGYKGDLPAATFHCRAKPTPVTTSSAPCRGTPGSRAGMRRSAISRP